MGSENKWINELQNLVNKPVYSSEGKEIGIISSVQSEKLLVTSGPITPDKYLIPTSSVKDFENGVVHLNNTSEFVDENYKFE